MTAPYYMEGTVAATNGLTTVLGTDTGWYSNLIRAGDWLVFLEAAGPVIYGIAEDAPGEGQLEIIPAYEGITGSGKTYFIARRFDEERAADTYRRINDLIEGLQALQSNTTVTINAVVADLAARAAYDGEAEGFAILVLDCTGETEGADRAAIYIMGSGGSGDWQGPAYITGAPGIGDFYVMSTTISERPFDEELILRHIFEVEVDFDDDFLGSLASADDASTGTAVFSIQKNDVEVGTISFTSSVTGVFNSAAPINFQIGDVLKLIAPTPRDATLSNVSVTLKGQRP